MARCPEAVISSPGFSVDLFQPRRSRKFGLVASGEADIYPRTGRTWEWDTAAGQAIVTAAGGQVTDADGNELRYGKANFLNPSFVACGLTD